MKKLSAPIERIAYTPAEAAAACGVGPDFFDEHISPHLDWVRLGTKRLVSVAELNRFMSEHAEPSVTKQLTS